MFAGRNPCDDEIACWAVNEDGHWCPSCGELIARPEWLECGMHLPDECKTCGYPDASAVAEYHCGPDEEEDTDAWMDDCAMLPDGTCMKAGSEECEWECPMRRPK